ncbi:MAG: adenosylmethionine--8-amino-7-oxononanoate transaminase [Chitinophagaceae bacterium]
MNLSERDRQVIWHPYTQMKLSQPPIGIVKGEGVYLIDEKGKKYIDAISSWWVNIHGHADPYIAEKVSEQLKKLEHTIFAGFTHEPAIELAERLLAILPAGQSKIFYSDNGSTAVEVAIKMALQYWTNQGKKKNKIIAFEQAYHGDTFGAMSVSARSSFTDPFKSLLFDVIHIPFPAEGAETLTIQQLKAAIEKNKDQIAAFIFEPLVLGAGGMLMYDAAILNELINACKDNAVLTIADEVMTGFGRTGKLFACDYLSIQPDITCLSKAITGGTMPLGVTSCTEEVFNAFLSDDRSKTFFHGHSYTANPVACSAALASLDLLLTDSCFESIRRIADSHLQFIGRNANNPLFKNLRFTGTILAMDILTTEQTSYFNSRRDQLYNYFIEKAILLRPLGNTVYVMPPYCISKDDLNQVYAALELIV